jgi:hypothetical protein
MLSNEECKKLLEQNGNKYTIQEAEIMNKFLQLILDIQLDQILKEIYDEESGNNGESLQ